MSREYKLIPSFNGGEVSPLIEGRTDLDKYDKLLKKCENYVVTPQGPAIFRPAFEYIGGTKTNAKQSRLVPFRFSNEQAYILEFGDLYIRFYRDGGRLYGVDANTLLMLHMNGNNGSVVFTDSSATGHTATANGQAQLAADEKKFGTAAGIFDAVGDYLSVADHADWSYTTAALTIDLWVYFRSPAGQESLYSQAHNAAAGGFINLYQDHARGKIVLHVDSTAARLIHKEATWVPSGSTWYHVAVVRGWNGNANDWAITVDGVVLTTFTASVTMPDLDQALWLGSISATLGIYDSGNTGHIITLANNVTMANSTGRWSGTQSSLLFDGTGDNLNMPDSLEWDVSNQTNVTIDVQVKHTDHAGTEIYIAQYENANNFWYLGHIHGSGLVFRFQDTGGGFEVELIGTGGAGEEIEDTDWHHVALCKVGDDYGLYLDGVQMASDSHATGYTKAGLLYVGELTPGTSAFAGNIQDARITHANTFSAAPSGGSDTITVPTTHPDSDSDTKLLIYGSKQDANVRTDEYRISDTARWTTAFVPPTVEYGLSADGGGTLVEVVTPYLKEHLFQLKFAQSSDTLYIAHKNYASRKLVRLSDAVWKLIEIEFLPAPLQVEKEDPSIALTLGQKAVGIGIAASDGAAGGTLFEDGDVGREIREDSTVGNGRAIIVAVADSDNATVDIFVAFSGTTVASGTWDFVGSNQSGTMTISGHYAGGVIVNYGEVVTLTCSLDVFEAGDVGKFVTTNDGTGIIPYKIMAYTNKKVVSAAALASDTYDTDVVMDAGEWELKKSVWTTNDYPSTVVFFENRLLWAGSPSFPQTIWASQADDYENHDPSAAADADAYAFTLAGKQVNTIVWMEDGDNLLIGTGGGEWAFGSKSPGTPVTPTNVDAKEQTSNGSADIQPVKMGQFIIYAQKGAKKLREMIFSFDVDRYKSDDLNLLAEHITGDGIIQMAFQNEPYSTLWMVRVDGVLIGLTLLKDQNVIAWHKHTTGASGVFESVAVIPGANEDELWAIIRRSVNGSTVRYIEKMDSIFNDDDLTTSPILFSDSGLKYDGVATTTISGLDHLEGETVNVIGDGVEQDDAVVSSGSITIDSASKVGVGVPYTGVLQLVKMEAGSSDGTAQGRIKRIIKVHLRFNKSYNALIGPNETDTDRVDFTSATLFSGDKVDIDYPEGYETDGKVTILQDKPFPQTVVAVVASVDTKEAV